ncbi:MFS transporter [Alicyclobacillus sp. SO9]|uniref:MDR family MFS transporter n=1 Tax=Alicyclobacillus sp. SO9 TaxID=2665646 RepID=UPI0018E86525|nr:MFS transporter [Alicyclobacillus sp. SO9]QQE77416.1 MFS transporter [Alicyclobacillus sp. SO9]
MIKRLWHHYDRAIWVRFFGQIITAVGNFMITPFITLYLYEKLHIHLMSTMVIASMSPAVGLVVGLLAGNLTDRFGRKSLMCVSLFGQAFSMLLFGFASTVWQFAVITILQGAFNAMYFPAASAQVTDVVKEEQRSEVFSLLHMGLNVGAAVGPLVGASFFQSSPLILFLTAAGSAAMAGLLILVYIPETKPRTHTSDLLKGSAQKDEAASRVTDPGRGTGLYVLIIWITVLSLPIQLLYAQVRTNLPIHLSHHFANYVHVFALMQTFNGISVIVLQMVIARITRKHQAWALILFSYVAFASVGIGYAFAPSLGVLLAVEFVFTLGEMIGFPQLQHVVSLLAPADKRGKYFSIFGLRWTAGSIVGPLAGGWVMKTLSGSYLFAGIGVVIFVSGLLMVWTLRTKARPVSHSEETVHSLS